MELVEAYRTLGVSASASSEEIYQAYQRQRGIHLNLADATYSLLNTEQTREELAHLDSAYRILSQNNVARNTPSRDYPANAKPLSSRALPSDGIARFQECINGKESITGQDLLEARKASGIEMNTLCQFTKIGDNYIKAIESMNLKELPERVYLRGFLSNYLGAFGIRDHKQLIDSYIQGLNPPAKSA
jgi:hypothetical protein